MKIELPKIKLKNIFSLEYFYILAAFLVIAVLTALALFLYQYFYQTIAQTKQVNLLKKEVAPESINLNEIDKILEYLDKKISSDGIDWQTVKNPFSASAAAPAPTPAAPIVQ